MYNVWFRKKKPTADDDSFWIRMANGGWTTWNNMGSTSTWDWVQGTGHVQHQRWRAHLRRGTA